MRLLKGNGALVDRHPVFLEYVRIDLQAQAGTVGQGVNGVLEHQGFGKDRGFQIYEEFFYPACLPGMGQQVEGGQKAGSEVRRVGCQQ